MKERRSEESNQDGRRVSRWELVRLGVFFGLGMFITILGMGRYYHKW